MLKLGANNQKKEGLVYEGPVARKIMIGETIDFTIAGFTRTVEEDHETFILFGTTPENELVQFSTYFGAQWAVIKYFTEILSTIGVTGETVDYLAALKANYGKTIIIKCTASERLDKQGKPYPAYTVFRKEEI